MFDTKTPHLWFVCRRRSEHEVLVARGDHVVGDGFAAEVAADKDLLIDLLLRILAVAEHVQVRPAGDTLTTILHRQRPFVLVCGSSPASEHF